MYSLIRRLLFTLPPEMSHTIALKSLKFTYLIGLNKFFNKPSLLPQQIMGLTFPTPIGLAAGLDKNADYIDPLASLGFGFLEVGTITPKPQKGNPKPRLFRLTKHKAIINRMGFNNKGVGHAIKRLEKMRYRGILGINIGKNKDTPNERAIDDYVFCFKALWKYASYITINISSPNTSGLRDLQQANSLSHLLAALKREQHLVQELHQRYVPLVVKISPDVSLDSLREMTDVFLQHKIDGVIATNTTIQRDIIQDSTFAKESGGLSGLPLQARSTEVIIELNRLLQDQIPIIASGGVMSKKDIQEKLKAGAKLVQVYTGFIYSGWEILL